MVPELKVDIDGEKTPLHKSLKTKQRSLQKLKSFPNTGSNSFKATRSKKWKDMYADILPMDGNPLPKLPEEEEVVGVITMEDVIEELLQASLTNIWNVGFMIEIKVYLILEIVFVQEEIYDETDHQVEESWHKVIIFIWMHDQKSQEYMQAEKFLNL